MYLLLRHLHMTCAVLSIGGFALRGALLLAGFDLPRRRWVRRVTDTNDALLLLAAAGLVAVTRQYPFVVPWVTAKLAALVLYVGLGVVAFRFAQNTVTRGAAWLAALGVAGFIVSVAINKNPYGFFAL